MVQLSDRDTLTPIRALATEFNSINPSSDEPHAFSVQPRAKTGPSTIQAEYVNVFPVAYENGEFLIPNYGYHFAPVNGLRYINGTLSVGNQKALKDILSSMGYETVGWYIEGSYYIDSYRPDMFRYYTLAHDGQSKELAQVARNGSNQFGVLGLLPQNPTGSYYTYGVKGTLSTYSYWPSLTGNPLSHDVLSIGLTVDFKNT